VWALVQLASTQLVTPFLSWPPRFVARRILVTLRCRRAISIFTCARGDVHCLIVAIDQANANGQPENTIRLETGTYTLTNIDNETDGPNGLPSITSTLTINVVGKKTVIRASLPVPHLVSIPA
jgi:hypothetical protein